MTEDKRSRRGRLVAVVGLDGAGKTTQVLALGDWLNGAGVDAVVMPNQSLSPVRHSLMRIAHEDGFADHLEMLGASTLRLISACAKLAYLARLNDLLASSDGIIVADRYTVCQYAAARAQGADNEAFLRRLNRALPEPDLTIFLDVEPDLALQRIRARGTDEESPEYLHAFRAGYYALPEAAGFVHVNGNPVPSTVQKSLRDAVASAFAQLRGLST